MSTNLDNDIEQRVQAHFTDRYGAPPEPDEVWIAISGRLGPQELPPAVTSRDGASGTPHRPGDTWLPLPGGPKPAQVRPSYVKHPLWRSFVMAASVVLALGVLAAGALGLAYMLDSRTPGPNAVMPTSVASPQTTAQIPEPPGQVIVEIEPDDWSLSGMLGLHHKNGIDTSITYNGKPSAYLKALSSEMNTYAELTNILSNAEEYAGKRIRFSAYVRSQDVQHLAGLWAQLDAISDEAPVFDGVQNRPIQGTTDWRKYSLTMELPQNATYVPVGLLLYGEGQVWIADARIELLDQNAPVLITPGSITTIYNPSFETGLVGWRWWHTPGGSSGGELTVDTDVAHSGDASVQLRADQLERGDQILLAQTIRAATYAGKRVRVSAYLKSENVTGDAVLWFGASMRHPGGGQITLAIDNMGDRPVRGTADWQKHEMVLDIPTEASHIDVGAILSGNGKVWVDDFAIEEVGNDVPTTGISMVEQPSNLSFDGDLAGWGRTGWAPGAYDYSTDTSTAYEGESSARIKSKSPFEGADQYTLLEQYLNAKQYVGKRVRVTGYLKSVDVRGVAGLFLRTYDLSGGQSVVDLSRLEDKQVTGTTDWGKYEVVMDVPDNTYAISYGLSITGQGEVWLDALALEVVGTDVPVTAPPGPVAP